MNEQGPDIILVPAYGRDYDTVAKVQKAYKDGWDFKMARVYGQAGGRYCSMRDFLGKTVKLRFFWNERSIYCETPTEEAYPHGD